MKNDNFDLDATQWSALRRLLDAALALPPAQRTPWLASLQGDDAALRARLRALLDHANDDGVSPLDGAPLIETAQLLDRAHGGWPQAGQSIGPYRLVRHLGEGGMGSVWLGERADGLVRRPVALKFPRLHTDRHGLSERLARERDFLAALDHPNIARLYDAGISDDGRPFLALEYVEGRRIDLYCDEHKLDTRARVRLFAQVADAVAHAHAKLIIHRDLKPANILVTAEGQARLLDFGIAKLIEDGRAGETELTQIGGRALTPRYASPEQVAGQPLSVAADVYSLGVVLYELLTGQPPYQPKRDTPAALEEEILRATVALPSTVAKDPAARRALRGDLDTIVAKALKKRPDERYATVNALAEDLQRFLAHRAVLARPDSVWYRARMFVLRNRLAVGAAASVFVTVLAIAAVALVQAQRATLAQARAEHVKAFIASVIAETDVYASADGPATTVTALLDRAVERVPKELADQPETRAELLHLLGKSYGGLFQLETAERVLAQGVAEAKALARTPANALILGNLDVELGEVKKHLGKLDEARALAAEARALAGAEPRTADASDLYAEARILDAGIALAVADWPAVIAAAQDVIRVSTAAHGEVNWRAAYAYSLIPATRGSGADYSRRMLEAARMSYTLFNRLYPDGTKPHPHLVNAEHNYGVALMGAGDLQLAEQHVAQSLAAAKRLHGEHSRIAAHYTVRLGQIHALRGELQRGLDEMQQTNALLERIEPVPTPATATRLRGQAATLLWLHRPDDALAVLAKARAIAEKGRDKRALLAVRADQALALVDAGRSAEAAPLIAAVDAEGTTLQPPERPLRVRARLELARGDAVAAQATLRQALEQSLAELRKPYFVDVQIDLARAAFALGQLEAAADHAREALAELERKTVATTPNHAAAWSMLGRVAMQTECSPKGVCSSAIAWLERADRAWAGAAPASAGRRDDAKVLAAAYRAAGRATEARIVERSAAAAAPPP